MKIVIEKELCNPIDGWTIPGPYYHVVRIDEETGEREVLKTFEKDIEKAARFAQHELDVHVLEVAYKKNPDSFKSVTSYSTSSIYNGNTLIEPIPNLEVYEGTVTGAGDRFTTICYEDCNGNRQLLYAKPGDYKYGDKVNILLWKNAGDNKNKGDEQ